MFERDETRYNLFVINCKDDGGLDREEARRRVMARVEVNLIYPFFPAPPSPLQFRFIYHLILLLETFGIEQNTLNCGFGEEVILKKEHQIFQMCSFGCWLSKSVPTQLLLCSSDPIALQKLC